VGSPATRALFAKHCAQCHSPQGEGLVSAHTPNMHDVAWQQARTAESIQAAIRDGKPGGMPPFGQVLTPPQIRSLAAYVRALR
jgi:cytochrome c oxidase cbb3-type subunit III